MPILLASVAMITSAQPRLRSCEAAPVHDAHHRHLPESAANWLKVVVQARDDRHVGVARPAATAFGKEHHRQLQLVRDAQHAIGLVMVAVGELLAGPLTRVLAGGPGPVQSAAESWFRIAVIGMPGILLVLAGFKREVLQCAAARLRRNRERAILKLPGSSDIAQVGDVGGACGCLGRELRDRSGCIERRRVAIDHLLGNLVEIALGMGLVHSMRSTASSLINDWPSTR